MGTLTSIAIGHNQYYAQSAGASSMIDVLAATSSGSAWEYQGFKFHATVACTGGTLTIAIDDALGTTHDTVVYSRVMTSIADLEYRFDPKLIMKASDKLNITLSYPSTGDWGMQHYWQYMP